MDRRIIWSLSAAGDIEAIVEYLRHSSPTYAKRFAVKAREAALSLKTLSERGRRVPEFPNTELREVFVDSFRLLYRVHKDYVEIVSAFHMARDLSNMDVPE